MPTVEELRKFRSHTQPQTLDLPAWIVLISIIILSAIFLSINLDLPVIRNSAVYAKISANLIKENFDLWKVNFGQHLGYGKPIIFPLLSVPLTLYMQGATGLGALIKL